MVLESAHKGKENHLTIRIVRNLKGQFTQIKKYIYIYFPARLPIPLFKNNAQGTGVTKCQLSSLETIFYRKTTGNRVLKTLANKIETTVSAWPDIMRDKS